MTIAPTTTLLVISDLHLGGAPAEDGGFGFQICPPRGQARLASFLDWAAALHQPGQRHVHLVIAGDIVDFLAERPFQAFTANDDDAARKLLHILERNAAVFGGLRSVAGTGASVTLLLGNHDAELSLPSSRRLLLDAIGPGRVEFIYDNQAFTLGPVLVEHGNRYDAFNAIPHDRLRQARSDVSRRGRAAFEALPGSEIVVQVVNEVKVRHSYVDLMKPEDVALLPFLVFLEPRLRQIAQRFVAQGWRASSVQHSEKDMRPVNPDYVAGFQPDPGLRALIDEMAFGRDPSNIAAGPLESARDFFARRWADATGAAQELELTLLHKALHTWAERHQIAFAINHEDEKYLKPARSSAVSGFEVVVYGHTHLAKEVRLSERSIYLNSGTWADLLKIPASILESESTAARDELRAFATALADNELGPFRTQVPTFAQIELTKEMEVSEARVRFFDGPGATPVISTDEILGRLQPRRGLNG